MRVRLTLSAALIVLAGCDSSSPVTGPPTATLRSAGTRARVIAPEFLAFNSPLPAAPFLGVNGLIDAGFSADVGFYPTPTVVDIVATGGVDISWYPGLFGLSGPAGFLDPGGRRTGFDGTGCTGYGDVRVQYHPDGLGSPFNAWRACEDGLATGFAGRGVVTGQVFARRSSDSPTNMIPGRCGGTGFLPCFTYSGGGTVTLTRVNANLTLDADKTEIDPGETVTFTTGADPASMSGVTGAPNMATPLRMLQWLYVVESTGEAIEVCVASPAPRTCQYQPPARGAMHAVAVVNGLVMSESKQVNIKDHELIVECTPSVQRGATVTCTARLEPNDVDFVVTKRVAKRVRPFLPDPKFLEDAPGITVAAGGTHEWTGIAAISTSVEITVSIPSDGKTKEESDQFQVTARSWPKYALAQTIAHDSGHKLDGKITYPPQLTPQGFPDTGSVGHLHLEPAGPLIDQDTVVGGPNDGWQYVGAPITTPPLVAYAHISIALDPSDPWYQKQFKAGPNDTHCSQAQVDTLRARVRAHEGVDPPGLPLAGGYNPISHFKVWEDFFDDRDVAKDFERLVARDDLFGRLVREWADVQRDAAQAQHVVHRSPNLVVMPGNCRLRP